MFFLWYRVHPVTILVCALRQVSLDEKQVFTFTDSTSPTHWR